MNKSYIALSRLSQEKGRTASGDLYLSPTTELCLPEPVASTEPYENIPDYQDTVDTTVLQATIVPSQQLPTQSPSYDAWLRSFAAYQQSQIEKHYRRQERLMQLQSQQTIIHQDAPYVPHQQFSLGIFGLQPMEQHWTEFEQSFESQLSWTPETPEEQQMVNLMSEPSFPWFKHNQGYAPQAHYSLEMQNFDQMHNVSPIMDNRNRDGVERHDQADTSGKAKPKVNRKKPTEQARTAIIAYKQCNPNKSLREIAERFNWSKTSVHRIITKVLPKKQPRGQTSQKSAGISRKRTLERNDNHS